MSMFKSYFTGWVGDCGWVGMGCVGGWVGGLVGGWMGGCGVGRWVGVGWVGGWLVCDV